MEESRSSSFFIMHLACGLEKGSRGDSAGASFLPQLPPSLTRPSGWGEGAAGQQWPFPPPVPQAASAFCFVPLPGHCRCCSRSPSTTLSTTLSHGQASRPRPLGIPGPLALGRETQFPDTPTQPQVKDHRRL